MVADPDLPDLDAYRASAREWLAANMPPAPAADAPPLGDIERWDRARELQRVLFDGGYAGIGFPREYGGQGLPLEYQRAFDLEAVGYEMPTLLNVPTLGIVGATLLDAGSEEQKRRYIPAMLRGDEVWVQFLSEPSGGSDLAGVLTTATRDGDSFVLNGSKIWSSGAFAADYGICVVRTNWDVEKYRGISVIIVPIDHPGVTVERIREVDGGADFCQEFFEDVVIPADHVVGEVDDGWTVVNRLLFHERNSVGGGSPYVSGGPRRGAHGLNAADVAHLARLHADAADPSVRQLVAEARVLDLVQQQLVDRVGEGLGLGVFPPAATSLLRLMSGRAAVRRSDISIEIAGASAAAWEPGSDEGRVGVAFLARQGRELGGGSVEMARNIISERLLGMPREAVADRGRPFSQVRRNRLPSRE